MTRVFLCAGEASGDALGASLLTALRARAPDLVAFGMGGPAMIAQGFQAEATIDELGVVGLLEVLRHLPRLFGLVRRLADAAIAARPDVAVLIDVPDFNLRLARRLVRAGIPVIFYVGPSVWAWRPGRVKHFAPLATRMLVLFPFEIPVWRAAGVDVRCVGHPLLDEIAAGSGEQGLEKTVALLPGSRRSEIARHLEILLGAALELRRRGLAQRFVLPVAPSVRREALEPAIQASGLGDAVELVEGVDPAARRAAVRGSSLALVTSGTATLETALLGTPQVILYRVNALSFWIGRLLAKVRFLGLPNLIADKLIVPELLQSALTPARLAETAAEVLAHPEEQRRALVDVRERLGAQGAAGRAAEVVLEVVRGATSSPSS
ncbi:MAG: lipid-A-disaccharide synthase [Myxococcota bacterium]